MADPLSVVNPDCPGCQALLGKLEALTARVEELERRLAQDSTNSHRPPSQDPPKTREQRRRGREKSGKKRGGQKGHDGHQRDLLPRQQVDHVEAVLPVACGDCGAALMGLDADPQRHQVTELPVLRPVVTEYELHALDCAHCGATTRADRPNGVPAGAFGPRLNALVGYLTASCRLSKIQTQELLADVLGIHVSTGAISTLEGRASSAVQAPVDAAREHVQQQATAYVDETRWWVAGVTAWLWVAVTNDLAVFAIRGTRGKVVAKELLGDAFSGTAVTDRFSAYFWIDPLRHQLCWAHLVRDFRKMAMVHDPEAAVLGERLSACARLLFAYWKRVKDGTLLRSSFRTYASALRKDIRQLLHQGTALEHVVVSGMCRAMLRLEPAMWTFVRIEGVEPTNNDAERELRHGVIYRRLCTGTHSERGNRFVERMLTVRASLRRQGRNVFQFLVDACAARDHGIPPPSLLPFSCAPA